MANLAEYFEECYVAQAGLLSIMIMMMVVVMMMHVLCLNPFGHTTCRQQAQTVLQECHQAPPTDVQHGCYQSPDVGGRGEFI
jgi:hypothetical protein